MAKRPSVLPGFGLTLGFTLFYLSLIVLIPLATLPIRTASMTWASFLGDDHGSARGCVVPAEHRCVAGCGDGQCRDGRARGLGARAL